MEAVFRAYLDGFADAPLPSTTLDPSRDCAAVIVEGRELPTLPLVMKNTRHFLGPDWNYYHINPGPITVGDYSALLKSRAFWEQFHESHVLIYQTDTVVLRELDPQFYAYDLIGALCRSLKTPVYNGGLSLRKRTAMLETIDALGPGDDPEDVYFTDGGRRLGQTLPTNALCDQFAVESRYQAGMRPFGVHGTTKGWLSESAATELVSPER